MPTFSPVESVAPALLVRQEPSHRNGAGEAFAAMLDGASAALDRADAASALLAVGKGSIAQAAIARAKADVALEIAAVAAARVGSAVTTLLQTQV